MPDKRRIGADMIIGLLLMLSLIITSICLIVGCLSIYFSDAEQIYTTEAVANTFKRISIPVFASLGLIVISFVFSFFSPKGTKPFFSKPTPTQLIAIISERRDLSSDSELENKITKEKKKQKKGALIFSLVAAVVSVIFLIYALDVSHFHPSQINSSMIKAMWVLLPCLAVSFAVAVIIHILNDKSRIRELELWKKAPLKSADEIGSQKAEINLKEEKKQKALKAVQLVLLILFIGIAVFGFISGGTADVLTKAINICTECIGLG